MRGHGAGRGPAAATPGLVWGEAHDGNAYALGGVAGHAGLFAPLDELAHFAQVLLAPGVSDVLSAESVTLMTSRQAGNGSDVRGIGWRLEPREWGPWPEATIWHTGFTGTSLLVAPSIGAAVVLLTNAVHPHRRLEDQAAVQSSGPPARGRGAPMTPAGSGERAEGNGEGKSEGNGQGEVSWPAAG